MAAIAGIALFMAACSKSYNGPTTSTKETKLTSHTWYVNAVTMSSIKMPGDTSHMTGTFTDSSFYTSCMHDDNLVFKSNHQFIFSNANTSCDSTTLPYGSGTWSFNTAEDSLKITSNGINMWWQVVTLSDSTLEAGYADSLHHVTTQLTFTSHK